LWPGQKTDGQLLTSSSGSAEKRDGPAAIELTPDSKRMVRLNGKEGARDRARWQMARAEKQRSRHSEAGSEDYAPALLEKLATASASVL
jgi:hypothetical protein